MLIRRSSLDEYLLATIDGNGHIAALSTTLTAFGKHARYASEQATNCRTPIPPLSSPRSPAASTNGSGSSKRASNQAVEWGSLHLTLEQRFL
jgi:hypothetical protein